MTRTAWIGRKDWIISLAVLAIGALLLGTRPLQDQDIFFHLAAGRAIVAAGHLPAFDPFIFPLAGTPTIYPEWGFEVLFHGAERLAGWPGVFALVALVGGLTCVMLYHIARRWTAPLTALLIVVCATALLEFRSLPRPEILLMLALAAGVWAAPIKEGENRYRWYWIPLIAWLLAMCHPSVALLLGAMGVLALEQAIRSRHPFPLAVMLAAGLAACLTPYGVDQVLLPYRFMGDGELIDTLSEFLPALDTEQRYLFLAALALGLASILAAGRKTSWGMALVFVIFAAAACRHARLIPLLAIPLTVLPSIACSVASGWRRRALPGMVGIMSLLASAVFATGPRGIGLDARALPEQAAARIASLPKGTRIANFFDFGAYFEWRLGDAYPLLVDARNFEANRAVRLHDAIFRADPGWEQFLITQRLNVVVTPPHMSVSGLPVPLFYRLMADPDWIMTDAELAGATFVRRTSAPALKPAPRARAWQSALWILDETLRADPANREAAAERKRIAAMIAGGD